MEDKQPRNILDMICDDQSSESKKNWKAFRDKLRLKRAGKAWTSSVPIPTSDIIQPKTNKMMIRRGSSRYTSEDDGNEDNEGEANRVLGQIERQRSTRLLPMETDEEEEDEETEAEKDQMDDGNRKDVEGDNQMSLMSLLSDAGSNYVEGHEEVHEGGEDEEEEEGDAGDCKVCSGCRGKHKGAELGPCGHSFCKRCTKELHVSRANCPTCNNYILEILDIY